MMTNIKNAELQEWLQGDSYDVLIIKIEDKAFYNFVRVKKNDTLDLVYCQQLPVQYHYKNERKEVFHYVGIYSKVNHIISKIFSSYLVDTSAYDSVALLEDLTKKVCSQVTTLLESPEVASRPELVSSDLLKRFESYCETALERESRNAFVTGYFPSFKIHYHPDLWEDDTIFNYLDNEDAFVNSQVDRLLQEEGEGIYLSFMIRQAVEKRVEEIENDPTHAVHIAKEIADTVSYEIDNSNIKTVSVTIVDKNGMPFTVKMKADTFLTDRPDGFSSRDIPEFKDREKYSDHMSSWFNPFFVNDIEEICYRKKVLYKKHDNKEI